MFLKTKTFSKINFHDRENKLLKKKYAWNIDKKRFYTSLEELQITESPKKLKTLKQKYKIGGNKKKHSRKKYNKKMMVYNEDFIPDVMGLQNTGVICYLNSMIDRKSVV